MGEAIFGSMSTRPAPCISLMRASRWTTRMQRLAVFGNAGGGKSTLARRLAELTRLPLDPLDLIQFKTGGGDSA